MLKRKNIYLYIYIFKKKNFNVAYEYSQMSHLSLMSTFQSQGDIFNLIFLFVPKKGHNGHFKKCVIVQKMGEVSERKKKGQKQWPFETNLI